MSQIRTFLQTCLQTCGLGLLCVVVMPAQASQTSQDTNYSSTQPRSAAASSQILERLQRLLGDTTALPEFLPVDEAFGLRLDAASANRIVARFTVTDGYYLYRDKIRFQSADPNAKLTPTLPRGQHKADPYFGEVAILNRDFSVPIAVQRASSRGQLHLRVTYQGCAERGICYAPHTQTFVVALP